jgi:hypothetical protein
VPRQNRIRRAGGHDEPQALESGAESRRAPHARHRPRVPVFAGPHPEGSGSGEPCPPPATRDSPRCQAQNGSDKGLRMGSPRSDRCTITVAEGCQEARLRQLDAA